MPSPAKPTRVYLEIGKTRTFVSAADWPGWCRSGRTEAAALQALIEHGPRYAQVLEAGGLSFKAAKREVDLEIVERLPGNVTTDFGAPDCTWPEDDQPLT